MVAEEDPGSMEVICITARSLDPTGRYRRPLGGAGTGSASSASSIPPFSITQETLRNTPKLIPVRSRVQRHTRRLNPHSQCRIQIRGGAREREEQRREQELGPGRGLRMLCLPGGGGGKR